MMKIGIFVALLIVILGACSSKNNSVMTPISLNKEVRFKLLDSVSCIGDRDLVFSNFLYPVRMDEDELISFDLLTNSLLFYNMGNREESKVVDLKSTFQMYPSVVSNIFAVLEVVEDRYLVCSTPDMLLVDRDMNVLKEFHFDLSIDSVNYTRLGDATNIRLDSSRSCLYIPVSPLMPANNPKSFGKGRILELNLETGLSGLLPIGLPSDYEIGKDYKLFTLPKSNYF